MSTLHDLTYLGLLSSTAIQSAVIHKHVRAIRSQVAPAPTTNRIPAPMAKMDSAPVGARFYDESFGRAPDEVLKANGYGVIRYMSHDPGKDITAAQAAQELRDGLRILLVWETTANRALDGFAAGQADAREFLNRSRALGYHGPLFFACDGDYPVSAVSAYYRGVVSIVGKRAGSYGGIALIEAGLTHWLWQTAAWSGGKVSSKAHLYQRIVETHYVAGTDENVVLHPINCWARP